MDRVLGPARGHTHSVICIFRPVVRTPQWRQTHAVPRMLGARSPVQLSPFQKGPKADGEPVSLLSGKRWLVSETGLTLGWGWAGFWQGPHLSCRPRGAEQERFLGFRGMVREASSAALMSGSLSWRAPLATQQCWDRASLVKTKTQQSPGPQLVARWWESVTAASVHVILRNWSSSSAPSPQHPVQLHRFRQANHR